MRKLIIPPIYIIVLGLILYKILSFINIEFFWTTLIVCFGMGYPMLYSVYSSRVEMQILKQERIINLHNNTIGELFVASQYPDYEKQYSDSEGNDYVSTSGAVICTKYVEEETNVRIKDNNLLVHVFCLLMCFYSFMLFSTLGQDVSLLEIYDEHAQIIADNIKCINVEDISPQINKIESNVTAFKTKGEALLLKLKLNLQFRDIIALDWFNHILNGWSEFISRVLNNASIFIEDIKRIIR